MNEKEFEEKMSKIKAKNADKEQRRLLREAKIHKKIQFDKILTVLIMLGIAINGLFIELYSCYVMLKLADISALYVLIGACVTTPIAEIVALCSYKWKAFNETKEAESIRLERDRLGLSDEQQDVEMGGV